MTEDIRKAVIRKIADNFQMPVYGQMVPQGGKRPCFTVELKKLEQKRLLGKRACRKVLFEINYFYEAEKTAPAKKASKSNPSEKIANKVLQNLHQSNAGRNAEYEKAAR